MHPAGVPNTNTTQTYCCCSVTSAVLVIRGVDPVSKVGGRGTNLYIHICIYFMYVYDI